MNTLEEKLWNYIDGTCNASEKKEVEELLADDASAKKLYNQLISFNYALFATEPDEPSMRFTQNVIERINKEYPAPLKTFVDKRIINGIAFIMLTAVIGLLLYAFINAGWSSSSGNSYTVPFKINFTPGKAFINGFLFIDALLGLFLIDKFLTRKRTMAEIEK